MGFAEKSRQLYFLIQLDQYDVGVWGASLEDSAALYGRPNDPGSISVSTACCFALNILTGNPFSDSIQRYRRYLLSRRAITGGFGMRRALGSSLYPVADIQTHARHTAAAIRFFLSFDGVDHEAVAQGMQFLLNPGNRTSRGLWVDHGERAEHRVDPITVSAVVGTLEAVRSSLYSANKDAHLDLALIDEAIECGLSHLLISPFRTNEGLWVYRFDGNEEQKAVLENSYRYSAGVLFECAEASRRTGIGLSEMQRVADHLHRRSASYGGVLPQSPNSNIPNADATTNLLLAGCVLFDARPALEDEAKRALLRFYEHGVFARTKAPDWAALVRLGEIASTSTKMSAHETAELGRGLIST